MEGAAPACLVRVIQPPKQLTVLSIPEGVPCKIFSPSKANWLTQSPWLLQNWPSVDCSHFWQGDCYDFRKNKLNELKKK